MSTIHIPERLENNPEDSKAFSFYPDSLARMSNVGSQVKSAMQILDTCSFKHVGQVAADTILSGSAVMQTNVINYTGFPIVCLDSLNRVQIIPPADDLNSERYAGCILFELVSGKALQHADEAALIWKRYSEVGTHNGNGVSNYYYQPHGLDEAPKYQGSNIHQFLVRDAIVALNEHDGSFYHPETDLVIMTTTAASTGDLVVHPRTDSTYLSKKDFDNANDKTITHQIRVNNRRSNATYVNIGGDVVEVPNLKNPNLEEGVYLRRFICRGGSRSKLISEEHYGFKDPRCPLNLFDSEDAAMTNGHPDKLLDLNIAKTKRETEMLKAELTKTTNLLSQEKMENDRLIENDRVSKEKQINEMKQKEALRQHKVAMERSAVEEEKASQVRDENKTSHRMRMLEIGGKIILAVAGIVTTCISLYRLKRI